MWCSWTCGHHSALTLGPAGSERQAPQLQTLALGTWLTPLFKRHYSLLQLYCESDSAVVRKAYVVFNGDSCCLVGEGTEANISLTSFCRVVGNSRDDYLVAGATALAARMAELFGRGYSCPLISGQQELACQALFKGKWPFPGRDGKTNLCSQESSPSSLPRKHGQSHWPWG